MRRAESQGVVISFVVTKFRGEDMPDANNPFESPQRFANQVASDSASQKSQSLFGMIIATLVAAVLAGLDYGYWSIGIVLFPGLLIFYFALAFWACWSGCMANLPSIGAKSLAAIGVAVIAAPAAFFLLFITCTPATSSAGVGFYLHGPPKFDQVQKLTAAGITFVLSAAVGGVLIGLFFLLPRVFRQPVAEERNQPPDPDSSSAANSRNHDRTKET